MSGPIILPAGSPPRRRKSHGGAPARSRFRRMMRELFGPELVVGALSIELPSSECTINKWKRQGYVEPAGSRWRLTAVGERQAR